MDKDSFFEILFQGVCPENYTSFADGLRLDDANVILERDLKKLEETQDEAVREGIEKIQEDFEAVKTYLMTAYFSAGVKFGIQLFHAALQD